MYVSKSQSIILAGSILSIFFLVGYLLMDTGYTPPPVERASEAGTPAPEAEGSKFSLREFHRVETKNGKKVWEVRGERGQYFPETHSAKVEKATLWLYKQDGDNVQLLAGTAKIDLEGASLTKAELESGVKVIYNDAWNIETEAAIYDKASERVTSVTPIKLSGERLELSAQELDADVASREFMLKGGVSTVIFPENEEKKTDAQP